MKYNNLEQIGWSTHILKQLRFGCVYYCNPCAQVGMCWELLSNCSVKGCSEMNMLPRKTGWCTDQHPHETILIWNFCTALFELSFKLNLTLLFSTNSFYLYYYTSSLISIVASAHIYESTFYAIQFIPRLWLVSQKYGCRQSLHLLWMEVFVFQTTAHRGLEMYSAHTLAQTMDKLKWN